MSLLETTQHTLKSMPRTVTLTHISKETGLSVSWLSDFYHNKADDYGVKKVETLAAYLAEVANNV